MKNGGRKCFSLLRFAAVFCCSFSSLVAYSASPTVETFTGSGAGTWVVPAGVTSVTVECWGGGGASGPMWYFDDSYYSGGGGGGGAYSSSVVSVTPGASVSFHAGAGGAIGTFNNDNANAGADSWFLSTSTVLAKGGGRGRWGQLSTGGAGGAASAGVGTTKWSGGNGRNGYAGGGGAGSLGDGQMAGATSHTGGLGGAGGGGNGGGVSGVMIAPGVPGGGGSGHSLSPYHGQAGAAGRVVLTYTVEEEEEEEPPPEELTELELLQQINESSKATALGVGIIFGFLAFWWMYWVGSQPKL